VLLSLTTTVQPATDLGYLLHKHPDRVQDFTVAGGTAYVFYPERRVERCTAALLLEVDPIGLVRGRQGRFRETFALGQYVNDRPYSASSLVAVALGKVFRTAMSGRCEARPALAETALPLEVRVPVLPCRGGPELAERLFSPLGWRVQADRIVLDDLLPGWGDSPYVDLRLSGQVRVADALHHLYVLLPVLDDDKHYWVGEDEVEKLLRAGSGWLANHPDRPMITRRYLAHQGTLTRTALARLAEVDDMETEAFDNAVPSTPADAAGETDGAGGGAVCGAPDRSVPLAEQRRDAVLAVLRASGARRVADLGCGEGALVAALLADQAFTDVVATDVSARALDGAARKLRLERMPEAKRQRLTLFQSSLTYRDDRLTGLDAAVLMEVVEHVDPSRLAALEGSVLGHAAPATVVVTTPNAEHNVRYEGLPAGRFRHRDHRFEWTRAEFGSWADAAARRFGYTVRVLPVGTDDPEVGPPTQLAVFTRQVADGSGDGGVSP
jgi:3' terminal RNA ribose 2'-O-methyltransferase Hen1